MGANKLYKENEVLFSAGDDSDGMYLVRSGELKVYLDEDGSEVQLATIGPGSMIGEMAFFEDTCRSASVKANKPSEVTKISNADFDRLLSQIPKWFVSLMKSLSNRLRVTNERLKSIESSASGSMGRYNRLMQIINFIELLFYKHGTKDGAEVLLPVEKASGELATIFQIDSKAAVSVIETISEQGLIQSKKDSYNNPVLVQKGVGQIEDFARFIEEFKTDYPDKTHLPEDAVTILEYAYNIAKDAPYPKTTVPLLEIIQEGEKDLLNTREWKNQAKHFKNAKPFIQLVKMGPGSMGLRVVARELRSYTKKLKMLSAFHKAGLDR